MTDYDTLTTIFRHNLWANLRLFQRCAELTEEQMAASIPGSRGSIRDTLEHIVKAERSYFSRISSGERYGGSSDAPPMTITEMIEQMQASGKGLIEWASEVPAGEAVEIDWDGAPRQVPKAILFTQVVNHATEHREQIKATMTDLGIEPPDLSSWEYFDQLYRQGSAGEG